MRYVADYAPFEFLEAEYLPVAESEDHVVIALRIEKDWLARNMYLLTWLLNSVTMYKGKESPLKPFLKPLAEILPVQPQLVRRQRKRHAAERAPKRKSRSSRARRPTSRKRNRGGRR